MQLVRYNIIEMLSFLEKHMLNLISFRKKRSLPDIRLNIMYRFTTEVDLPQNSEPGNLIGEL